MCALILLNHAWQATFFKMLNLCKIQVYAMFVMLIIMEGTCEG